MLIFIVTLSFINKTIKKQKQTLVNYLKSVFLFRKVNNLKLFFNFFVKSSIKGRY